jgi:hypothetical protein
MTGFDVAAVVTGGASGLGAAARLKNIRGWSLAGRETDDEGMLELLEPWRGQRQRVVRLILAGGRAQRPPRHGPRLAPTIYRRI